MGNTRRRSGGDRFGSGRATPVQSAAITGVSLATVVCALVAVFAPTLPVRIVFIAAAVVALFAAGVLAGLVWQQHEDADD